MSTKVYAVNSMQCSVHVHDPLFTMPVIYIHVAIILLFDILNIACKGLCCLFNFAIMQCHVVGREKLITLLSGYKGTGCTLIIHTVESGLHAWVAFVSYFTHARVYTCS